MCLFSLNLILCSSIVLRLVYIIDPAVLLEYVEEVPQYFTEKDIIVIKETEIVKKTKLLVYKDESKEVPSPKEWEFNGPTIIEIDKILENKKSKEN